MISRRVKQMTLAFATASLALVAVEIAIRAVGLGQVVEYVPSERWGYLMKPSQEVWSYGHPVNINSSGLRGPDFSVRRQHAWRVLFVGDSVTYGGAAIPDKEVFAQKVGSLLEQSGIDVETISLAAPGWSPQNWIAYIEANGLFDANAVVLTLPECDLARPFSTVETFGLQEKAPFLRLRFNVSRMVSHFFSPMPPCASTVSNTVVEANLRAVSKLLVLAADAGALSTVVFVPSEPPTSHSTYWPRFEAVVSDPLDLREELTDPGLFLDTAHLSAQGHDLVAQRVSGELRSRFEASEERPGSLRAGP